MARIETDPNYSSPTFSRATDAADLFKKTDVQALAEALSTHDHTNGKGLAVARLAASCPIPVDSVGTGQIIAGSIQSGDIAVGSLFRMIGQTPNGTPPPGIGGSGAATTSPTAVDVPGLTIPSFTVGANSFQMYYVTMGMNLSAAGSADLAIVVDGAGLFVRRVGGSVPLAFLGFTTLSPGTHSAKVTWNVSQGTPTIQCDYVTSHQFWIAEFQR
jgi:hypothetical protein